MRTTDLDISKLSLAERIQLAEDLWDSVAAETGGLPLTEAQAAELDHRLGQLARDPGAGGLVGGRARAHPGAARQGPDDPTPRRAPALRRFPYGIYFVATPDLVSVVACMHARRDPRRWEKRVGG